MNNAKTLTAGNARAWLPTRCFHVSIYQITTSVSATAYFAFSRSLPCGCLGRFISEFDGIGSNLKLINRTRSHCSGQWTRVQGKLPHTCIEIKSRIQLKLTSYSHTRRMTHTAVTHCKLLRDSGQIQYTQIRVTSLIALIARVSCIMQCERCWCSVSSLTSRAPRY